MDKQDGLSRSSAISNAYASSSCFDVDLLEGQRRIPFIYSFDGKQIVTSITLTGQDNIARVVNLRFLGRVG